MLYSHCHRECARDKLYDRTATCLSKVLMLDAMANQRITGLLRIAQQPLLLIVMSSLYGQPKNSDERSRPVTIEVRRAASAAGTAKRVFLIPTLPKYSASV